MPNADVINKTHLLPALTAEMLVNKLTPQVKSTEQLLSKERERDVMRAVPKPLRHGGIILAGK